MFTFSEDSYIATIAFIGWKGSDLLLIVHKDNAISNEWKLEYRFRYYDPGHENDPSWPDRKSWYGWKLQGTEKEIISKLKEFIREIVSIRQKDGEKSYAIDIVEIGGDAAKLMKIMQGKSWWHVTKVEKVPKGAVN